MARTLIVALQVESFVMLLLNNTDACVENVVLVAENDEQVDSEFVQRPFMLTNGAMADPQSRVTTFKVPAKSLTQTSVDGLVIPNEVELEITDTEYDTAAAPGHTSVTR